MMIALMNATLTNKLQVHTWIFVPLVITTMMAWVQARKLSEKIIIYYKAWELGLARKMAFLTS